MKEWNDEIIFVRQVTPGLRSDPLAFRLPVGRLARFRGRSGQGDSSGPGNRIENRSRQDLRSGSFEEFISPEEQEIPSEEDYDCSKPAQSPKVSQVGSLPTRVVLEGMDDILHSEEFGTPGMPPH